ncbi:MFS transporter [Methylorubrum extorquens]
MTKSERMVERQAAGDGTDRPGGTSAGNRLVGEAPAPDNWVAVISLGVASFALVTSEFVPVGFLPAIAQEFDVTGGYAGLLVTVPGVVAAVTAPLAAVACGRFDRRHVLLLLTFLFAASNVIVALSTTFGPVLFGRVLLGIGVGGFWTIGGSMGPRLVPGPGSVRATGIILSGIALGTVVGVPIGTVIGDTMGWRWAFWATAAVSLCILAVQWRVLPSLTSETVTSFRRLRECVGYGPVAVGLLMTLLSFSGHFAAYTYVTPLMAVNASIDGSLIGMLFAVYGVGTILGNLTASYLIGTDVRPVLLASCTGVGLAALGLGFQPQGLLAVSACLLAWGISYGALPVSLQTWMFRAYPRAPESVTSLFVFVAQFSIGGGSLIGGACLDLLGPSAPFWAGGLCALCTMPLILLGTGPFAAVRQSVGRSA